MYCFTPVSAHRDPHSFPTRRSSDLAAAGRIEEHAVHGHASDRQLHRRSVARAAEVRAVRHHARRCWKPGLQRSEEHTSELQSPCNLVCRLLLEKKKKKKRQ